MTVRLREFECGAVHHEHFHHRDHVRVAYELVARHPYDVALARFVAGLRTIAAAAGDPTKVHMTITAAFVAAIAERQLRQPTATWEAFAAGNPELLEKSFIRRWYPAGELETDIARRTFLLPIAR